MQDQDNFLHGKSKFSESEKLYLASLVEQVSDIIECTKTDGASTMAKENAWRMITEEYANGYKYGIKVPRSKEQLKRCWYNLKYRCRKADSAEKHHRLKTGGGKPLSPNPEEEINNKVRAIVPTINFTLENPWDSTSQLENSFDSTNYEFLDENIFDEDLDIECSDSNDFNLSLNNKIQCSAEVSSKKDSVINTVGKILKKQPKIQVPSPIIHRKPLHPLENRPSTSFNNDILGKRLEKVSDNMIDGTSNKKRKFTSAAEMEKEIRFQKNEEAITQQRKLHNAKIEVIKKECEYWQKMIDSVNIKQNIFATELEAEKTRLQYWQIKSSAYSSHLSN